MPIALALLLSLPASAQVVVAPLTFSLPSALPTAPAAPAGLEGLGAAGVPFGSLDPLYKQEISKYPILDREQERELATASRAGDVSARKRLASHNLRLVMSIAKEYTGYGVPYADLVEEGNVGLMIAIGKFDPATGNKLVTYAPWWIRAMILRYIQDNFHIGGTMTNAAHRKLFFALRRAQEEIGKAHGAELAKDPDFIAKHFADVEAAKPAEDRTKLVIRPVDVQRMLEVMGQPVGSLDAPMDAGGESKTTFIEAFPSVSAGADERFDAVRRARRLEEAVSAAVEFIARRDPRLGTIIRERLLAEEPLTLQELGDKFGLSRERARQLETRAKELLKAELSRRLAGTGELDE